jgi:hypothetical protein
MRAFKSLSSDPFNYEFIQDDGKNFSDYKKKVFGNPAFDFVTSNNKIYPIIRLNIPTKSEVLTIKETVFEEGKLITEEKTLNNLNKGLVVTLIHVQRIDSILTIFGNPPIIEEIYFSDITEDTTFTNTLSARRSI